MRALALMGVLGAMGALAACDSPSCQSACRQAYGEATGECSIRVPGRTPGELIQDCISRCENALDQPGEIGDYDPYTRNTSGQTITLENERQAAEWMTCVVTSDCSRLNQGYCEPI